MLWVMLAKVARMVLDFPTNVACRGLEWPYVLGGTKTSQMWACVSRWRV